VIWTILSKGRGGCGQRQRVQLVQARGVWKGARKQEIGCFIDALSAARGVSGELAQVEQYYFSSADLVPSLQAADRLISIKLQSTQH